MGDVVGEEGPETPSSIFEKVCLFFITQCLCEIFARTRKEKNCNINSDTPGSLSQTPLLRLMMIAKGREEEKEKVFFGEMERRRRAPVDGEREKCSERRTAPRNAVQWKREETLGERKTLEFVYEK